MLSVTLVQAAFLPCVTHNMVLKQSRARQSPKSFGRAALVTAPIARVKSYICNLNGTGLFKMFCVFFSVTVGKHIWEIFADRSNP